MDMISIVLSRSYGELRRVLNSNMSQEIDSDDESSYAARGAGRRQPGRQRRAPVDYYSDPSEDDTPARQPARVRVALSVGGEKKPSCTSDYDVVQEQCCGAGAGLFSRIR